MERRIAYGAWPSPISADRVARGGIGLAGVAVEDDGTIWWDEQRPAEDGRYAVVRRDAAGAVADALPAGWSARSRVHEYGGGAWAPIGAALVFVNWADQRLYRIEPGGAPRPLAPDPPEPQAHRYADLVASPDGRAVWCVRERAVPGGVTRALVAVPLDGSGVIREVVAGSHFLSTPRPSPDGRRLAWLAWEHPRMPWDGTELRVGELTATGTVEDWRSLLGGPSESVFQPEWTSPDALYAVSDRTGWWNLYAVPLDGRAARPLCARAEEFGVPQWQFGFATYARLADGRLAVLHGAGAMRLSVLDPVDGSLREVATPFAHWRPGLRAGRGDTVVGVAGGPTAAFGVVEVDIRTGACEPLRSSLDDVPDPAWLPAPEQRTFDGAGGREVHAVVYPPRNPDAIAPAGELPPYVVWVHGGPTAHSTAVLDIEAAYFTSRGIGIVDVNYGGSSGYGRAYRERLRGQWGVVDVEDCVAAALSLAEQGEADPARLAIRGGSAGGWTTLAALTRTDAFAAGASYYGVAELIDFVANTHDFESRYIDGLVGELPADHDVYVERAPLSHVDELSCPVLLLQGLEDQIVPPSQAEMFRDALVRKGIRHAYLTFEGEQHGFRRAESIARSLEAELSFYGQVFGFTPPDVPILPLS